MRRTAAFPVLLTLLFAAQNAAAQQARTKLVPDSVTVGDVFRATVRVAAPVGARVVFPDTLEVPENVEATARREVTVDSSRAGVRTYIASFPLAAWKPGSVQLPTATVRIELPDGGRTVEVEADFPRLRVHSVLPVDTAGIQPRPPKDVLGPSRLLWPAAVGLGLLAALLGSRGLALSPAPAETGTRGCAAAAAGRGAGGTGSHPPAGPARVGRSEGLLFRGDTRAARSTQPCSKAAGART